MGSVHVHEFVSADGVIDAPTWTYGFEFVPGMLEVIGAVTDRCAGILLGRRTYEEFEGPWSTRTDGDPGTAFFNESPKFVVSSTLSSPTWQNSTAIGAYDPDRIRKLKEDVGDLYVSGSGTLVRAMLADGLVDELHLLVYPLTRGGGPRLFADGAEPLEMALADSRAFDHGVVYLNYRPQSATATS